MSETNDVKETIEDKLKYIGLDLNNIPKFLYEFEPLNFRPLKGYDERKYKVYEYVPVRDIQILVAPSNRDEDLNEKYKLATPIFTYLESDNEEYIRNYSVFLNMLKNLNINKIKELEEFQDKAAKDIPYEVKYTDNYLWQVYYSDFADKYFMLVPEKEYENAALFYLIKKQIEAEKNNEDIKIYIPISHMEYSEELLTNTQITDLENYIWLFTRDWPSIYEVYNYNDELSIQILGNTKVYEKISSVYKIKLENKKQANEFYNLIKALFILETDLPHQYTFIPKIDKFGNLQFTLNNEVITYTDLAQFLKKEVMYKLDYINEQKNKIKKISKELNLLKQKSEKQNNLYMYRQKQIASFLECKKSFFGKVKFFFKRNKNSYIEPKVENELDDKKEKIQENTEDVSDTSYTIENLIVLCHKVDDYEKKIKNIELDIKAIKNTIKLMEKKIENATKYIEEIEEHQKSFFEFMRYTSKDSEQVLTEAIFEEIEKKPIIKKSFDYEDDIEELGKMLDKLQREKFTKNECDAIFALQYVSKCVNYINNETDCNEEEAKKEFENLKNEFMERQEEYQYKAFDIFGAIVQDQTKIKRLNNVKHREIERDKFEILKIKKNTEFFEYIENIKKYMDILKKAYKKIESFLDISLYLSRNVALNKFNIEICSIDPYKEIEELLKSDDETIHLYRFHINKGMNIIFYTNIIYYDNKNNTLPIGMDVKQKGLIDFSKYSYIENFKTEFNINIPKNELYVNTKNIIVHDMAIKE